MLFGKYDVIYPIIKEEGYDYFLFTDQHIDNKTNNNWKILKIDEKIVYSNISDIKKK